MVEALAMIEADVRAALREGASACTNKGCALEDRAGKSYTCNGDAQWCTACLRWHYEPLEAQLAAASERERALKAEVVSLIRCFTYPEMRLSERQAIARVQALLDSPAADRSGARLVEEFRTEAAALCLEFCHFGQHTRRCQRLTTLLPPAAPEEKR